MLKSSAQADTTDINGEYQLFDNTVSLMGKKTSSYNVKILSGNAVLLYLDIRQFISLSVVDLFGNSISLFSDRNLAAGIHQFQLPTEKMSGGIYFLKLMSPGVHEIFKITFFPHFSTDISPIENISFAARTGMKAADTVMFTKSGYISIFRVFDNAYNTLDMQMAPTNSSGGSDTLDVVENNSMNYPFITFNPFDFKQIFRITSLRSCAGHDFRPMNAFSADEPASSMKHYIDPFPDIVSHNSNSEVKIFAPFDGHIACVIGPQDGYRIQLAPDSIGGWTFELYHAELASGLASGSSFHAGDLIGFAHLNGHANFDVAVRGYINARNHFAPRNNFHCTSLSPDENGNGPGYDHYLDMAGYLQFFDSFLNHMAPSVTTEFSAVGLTANKCIISKAARIAIGACDFTLNASQLPADNFCVLGQ